MLFKILHQSKKSKARLGVLTTPHGKIYTPSFVPVATKGTLKSVPPRLLKESGVQVAFVNTFHLAVHPGPDVVAKLGGIHRYGNLGIPLMSDSAGFQVFSLGKEHRNRMAKTRDGEEAKLLGIEEKGVRFRSPKDGKEMVFTPELSMKYQEQIGADLIMAFDECIPYGSSYEYTKEATERTHRWLERCVKSHKKEDQALYGIIQGGVFKDLREMSARFVAKQDTEGIAIGGVAIGEPKKELREQVGWVAPYLPREKPVHLLGAGYADDILYLVKQGMDTFDCVEPTRIARNGSVFVKQGNKVVRLDVLKSKWKATKAPISPGCSCYACTFSLSFIHHLFKERELLGYELATLHNLKFFADFFADIREEIRKGGI